MTFMIVLGWFAIGFVSSAILIKMYVKSGNTRNHTQMKNDAPFFLTIGSILGLIPFLFLCFVLLFMLLAAMMAGLIKLLSYPKIFGKFIDFLVE